MVDLDGKVSNVELGEGLAEDGKNLGVGNHGVIDTGNVKVLRVGYSINDRLEKLILLAVRPGRLSL